MVDKTIGVIVGLIGLASLAVVISKKSDTAKVIGAFANGLNKIFQTAVSPVTKA